MAAKPPVPENDAIVLCCPVAVCAAGGNLAELASATHAGLRPLVADARLALRSDGRPIATGRVAAVDDIHAPVERLIQLARLVIEPCAQAWRAAGVGEPGALPQLPALLVAPAERPGLDSAALDWVIANALHELPGLELQRSGAIRGRHDGFAAVVQVAAERISAGEEAAILVGAFDSGIDPTLAAWLEETGRLRSGLQPHGLAPGEGAAACVVTRASWAAALGLRSIVLHACARAEEPRPWYLERPTLGEGLTTALHHALSAGPVDVCYADLTGESWRSAEWDFAYLRNGRQFADPIDLRHPAESWGDTGAASGALLTLLAAWDLWQGRSLHRAALVATSADTQPGRAALRLALPTAEFA
jgi:3-oxoacyl-[acyl-carrier-protein] synthase-1